VSLSIEQQIEALRDLYRSERDPHGRAFAPLADAYRRAGLVKEALALLREGLAELPDFTTGHVVAARVYMDTGLTAEAELSSLRALELDPENAVALKTLAVALETRGAVDEAKEVRERLAELEAPSGWSAADEDGSDAPAWEEPRPVVDATSAEAEGGVVDIEMLLADGGHEPEVAVMEAEVEDDEVVDIDALLAEESSGSEGAVGVQAESDEVEAPAILADSGEAEVEDDEVVDIEALAAQEAPTMLADSEDAEVEDDEVVRIDERIPQESPTILADSEDAEVEDDEVIDIDALAAQAAPMILADSEDAEVEDDEVVDIDEHLTRGTQVSEVMADLEAEAQADQVVEIADLLPGEDLTPELAGADRETETEDVSEAVVGIDSLVAEPVSAFDVGASSPSGAQDDRRDVVRASTGARQEDEELVSEEPGDGLPVVTRTLAELFVAQGLTDRAIGVYRQLLTAFPDDGLLESRLAELEESAALSSEAMSTDEADPLYAPGISEGPETRSDEDDLSEDTEAQLDEEDVSDHAWHLGAHEQRHDVDTPFAWIDTEPDERPSSPAISTYFHQLLSWEPSRASDPPGVRDNEPPQGGLEEVRNGEDG
jgi:tetratricopeptide (TPR) repeat protein